MPLPQPTPDTVQLLAAVSRTIESLEMQPISNNPLRPAMAVQPDSSSLIFGSLHLDAMVVTFRHMKD